MGNLSENAKAQLAWLATEGLALELRERIEEALALGPRPHAYRRIKKTDGGALVLAVKEWRARFSVQAEETAITVESIASGFRPRELATGSDPGLAMHRAFVTRFG